MPKEITLQKVISSIRIAISGNFSAVNRVNSAESTETEKLILKIFELNPGLDFVALGHHNSGVSYMGLPEEFKDES